MDRDEQFLQWAQDCLGMTRNKVNKTTTEGLKRMLTQGGFALRPPSSSTKVPKAAKVAGQERPDGREKSARLPHSPATKVSDSARQQSRLSPIPDVKSDEEEEDDDYHELPREPSKPASQETKAPTVAYVVPHTAPLVAGGGLFSSFLSSFIPVAEEAIEPVTEPEQSQEETTDGQEEDGESPHQAQEQAQAKAKPAQAPAVITLERPDSPPTPRAPSPVKPQHARSEPIVLPMDVRSATDLQDALASLTATTPTPSSSTALTRRHDDTQQQSPPATHQTNDKLAELVEVLKLQFDARLRSLNNEIATRKSLVADDDYNEADIADFDDGIVQNRVKLSEVRDALQSAITAYGEFVRRRGAKDKRLIELGILSEETKHKWQRKRSEREDNQHLFMQYLASLEMEVPNASPNSRMQDRHQSSQSLQSLAWRFGSNP